MDKETAKIDLQKLIGKYEGLREEYFQKGYDEKQFCDRVLDDFFKILGWDVDNIANNSEYYCDVEIHYKLKTGKTTKFPDYAFGLPAKSNLKFFVEAKTPSTKIKIEKEPAHQIRRYGNSAGLAVSLLTNFEELAVYDCSKKPSLTEGPNQYRIKHLFYFQYIEHFDFLWDNFSVEGVKKGNFDKFIKTDTKKKGSAPLDQDFVETLDKWRELLAKNIAKNNSKLNGEEINFAVQQTIDRIIFLRFCEDKNIEHFGALKDNIRKGNCYKNLYKSFKDADNKYNSGLFDFDLDKITEKIIIDDKTIETIIEELYRPKSEYEFGVMPVEILGNAYEEFLGKVIKITPGHHAKIDISQKAEVQKAGGVFYTPQYIVNYIVDNTLGKLIKGKNPETISKIKIIDPACGSGSFLLGAYVYLLRYHTDYYWSKGYQNKRDKSNLITPDGKLTVAEKKKILTNNIFGVDIDPNAVEVTKLSLLLKAMEGETEESVTKQLQLFRKGILPNLDENIKCGNSLIDKGFYKNVKFSNEIDGKIRSFNWDEEFPTILKNKNCGFDIVIGNPPYIQLAMYDWFDEDQKKYLINKHCSTMGRMNTFGFFIENGLKTLLNKNGMLGFIIPNTILTQEYYQKLRKLILTNAFINEIVSYEHMVFWNAVVETTTLVLTKRELGKINDKSKITLCKKDLTYSSKYINQKVFNSTYKNQFTVNFNNDDASLKTKINKNCTENFNDICEINQAIALKADRSKYLFNKKLGQNYKPVLDGGEILKYQTNWEGKYLKYDIQAIHSCKRQDIFNSKEKIFFRRVSSSIIATIDTSQFFALNTLVVMNIKKGVTLDIKFILGILNSKLINYYYKKFLKSSKKVFSEIQARQIGQIPIPQINFKNQNEKAKYNEIIKIVRNLLLLNKDSNKIKHPTDKIRFKKNLKTLEDRLDILVFDLYGLAKEDSELILKN